MTLLSVEREYGIPVCGKGIRPCCLWKGNVTLLSGKAVALVSVERECDLAVFWKGNAALLSPSVRQKGNVTLLSVEREVDRLEMKCDLAVCIKGT